MEAQQRVERRVQHIIKNKVGGVRMLLQLILGSIQTPLAPNADWRRDWDPQPSDFRDLISHYEDGSMMRDQSMRACGRNIQSLIKKKRPLHTTVYKEGTLHYFQNAFGY